LWYEYDLNTKKLIREKHWWPQAEAMVGFFNGWQVTGDQRFLDATLNCWNFITTRMLNPSGEWYWGIDSIIK
jgi:mannobiose 2-epimerase